MAYAINTAVSVEKSRAEIERILHRYGADKFAYMTSEEAALICFGAHGKMVKFALPLPRRADFNKKKGRLGYPRIVPPEQAFKAWEQACRTKWRALCLCVKAKLEAVDSGITTFEVEFLAHFVLPSGKTFGEYAIPQLEEATKSGKMPQLTLEMK